MSAVHEPNVARRDELRADRALAGLTPLEAAELAALSRGAPNDARESDELELAAAALDLALFPARDVALSPQLRARILASAAAATTSSALQHRQVAVPRERRTNPAWLAAAALLIAALAGWWPRIVGSGPANPADQVAALEREAGDLLRVDWSTLGDPAAKGAGGSVLWSSARQQGYMKINGLAPNDITREQYQLWIFDADHPTETPVDGGVFDIRSGQAIVPIQAKLPVGKVAMFAVTVERPGGVVVSKRERIVLLAKAG